MRNTLCRIHPLRFNFDPEARLLFKDTAVKFEQRFQSTAG